jgi:Mn2+/Fe2+ NRAMP family transporter
MPPNERSKKLNLLRTIGPGLLFASSAIGTSHLVLSTRAGAHHGMVYFWIIIAALLLKYPFYEFGPRYANATGFSLLKGYKEQGTWAVLLFLFVVTISMFTVTGAISAVTAGLLATMFGVKGISIPLLAGLILGITVLLLLFGGYSGLDRLIKLISVVLLITVFTAFVAVLLKGPVEPVENFQTKPLLEGAGLALLISLLGWMPAGMEASTMNSIWSVEKMKETNYHPKLTESLFDFNLGYVFTLILALMFMTIGAFTVYGTEIVLDGNATQFSNKLLNVFVSNLGDWSYYVIAIAAFGTIYGTLITVVDAFPRCFARGLRVLKFEDCEKTPEQIAFLEQTYKWIVVVVGFGGFALFYFSAASMLQLLQYVTILSFLLSPLIAFINLRAIQSPSVPLSHRPSYLLMGLAYSGLFALVAFSIYYMIDLI